MNYYAWIKDNKVVNIMVAELLSGSDISSIRELHSVDNVMLLNDNTSTYIGADYSPTKGFIPLKPAPSWSWNNSTNKWEAPTPKPTDGKLYQWDETTQTWDIITVPNGTPETIPSGWT